MRDIELNPESMSAGLASNLLHTVIVMSPRLQEMVTKSVFLKMVGELNNAEANLPITRILAYLTVLTSIVQKVALQISEVNYATFMQLTLLQDEVCSSLENIVASNLQLSDDVGIKQHWTSQ